MDRKEIQRDQSYIWDFRMFHKAIRAKIGPTKKEGLWETAQAFSQTTEGLSPSKYWLQVNQLCQNLIFWTPDELSWFVLTVTAFQKVIPLWKK